MQSNAFRLLFSTTALTFLLFGCGAATSTSPPTTGANTTERNPNDNVASVDVVMQSTSTQANPSAPEILPITLVPGFRPDPMVLSGTAGGSADAHSIGGDRCPGHVALEPSHFIKTTNPSQYVRIVASGPRDLVLMLQMSDGTFICNDDSEGLNPAVEAQLPAGIHRVWVGTFGQIAGAPYRIGFSAQNGLAPSAIDSN